MAKEVEKPADVSAETSTPTTVDATQLAQQFRADLDRYTNKFGAVDGLEYFRAGKTFEAALEEHVNKLSVQIVAEKKRADDAEAKIHSAKLSIGEQPINTGTPKTDANGDKKPRTFGDLIKPANKS